MHAFSGRSRRRKSDVVPLFNITPAPPDINPGGENSGTSATAAGSHGGRRLSRIKPMSWSQRNVIPEDTASTPSNSLATAREDADDDGRGHTHGKPPSSVGTATTTSPAVTATATPSLFPPAKSARKLNLFAQSVISMNRQQQQQDKSKNNSDGSRENDGDGRDDGEHANGHTVAAAASSSSSSSNNQSDGHDPWGHVLDKVMRKSTPVSKRVSLTQVLQRRGVKDLVKQAVIASHWTESTGTGGNRPSTTTTTSNSSSAPRSSVMEHWMKTSVLRHANPLPQLHPNNGDDSEFDDDGLDSDARDGIKSGFDVRETAFGAMYGRTLLLEESCRRAFAQSGENRSQMDLQALKAWFQMTKLKITTDFERLQPAELDLLCRRMALVHLHANEIVFRQGDEGDAMYIVFAGSVEVKVAQRILGEKVEVTVCELSKGDYFGERALLHDDPRAATIVAKTVCELVKITRKDYTIMLKQDQQEFFSRMQLAGSVATSNVGGITGSTSGSGGSTTNPSLILPRSRSTLHQQTQVEYVNVLSKKKNSRTKADIDMLSEYLQTLKFFRGLPRAFVRELCTVIDFLTLPASTYVFREGEVGDLFYIIFSGSVDVIVSSKDFRGNAQQTKLINLTEGSHFGELALMKGHGIRSATVLTREETRFLVICEKDYNSTLRRMQKEDLAKRVGVLDRIPMFQTPEWTGELLKEMSYVLSEQKLATGSVLFRQGEKAQQVYFVVRGELSVTKEIVDPTTNQTNVAFVERIGRDRVVGDDAAAGANFNEVIYREVTITASTPVELLVLSKYDVFHRLSRSARETLRAAAQSHVESVVYLDRYHKTIKWDAYKAKLLQDHMNHARLRKLLPEASAASSSRQPTKRRKTPRDAQPGELTESMDAAADDRTAMLPSVSEASSGTDDGTGTGTMTATGGVATISERDVPSQEVRAVVATTQSQLVDANEFLLLAPVDAAMDKCFSPHRRSLAHHVTSFNADAPPRTQSRETQLRSALHTERRRRREVLNEGNPLAYFDLDVVQAQQRQQQAEVRGRAASSRRLLLRKRPSAATAGRGGGGGAAAAAAAVGGDSVAAASAATIATATSAAADTAAANVLNQFFQDNFIFSHPETPVRRKPDKAKRLQLLHELEQRHGLCSTSDEDNDDDVKTLDGAAQLHGQGLPGGKPLIRVDEARRFAESLCHGDVVVVEVMKSRDSDDAAATGESPRFRIVRCAESLDHAKAELLFNTPPPHLQQHHGSEDDRSDDEGARGGVAPPLFTVAKKKFALLPRATRPRVTEEALQRAVATKFLHPFTTGSTTTHSPTATTAAAASGSAATSPSDVMASVFASFQRLALTPAEQRDRATSVAATAATRSSKLKSKGAHGKDSSSSSSSSSTTPCAKLFAIVSIVLSKRELETAFCDEPLLCVHALLPTEAEAMDQALRMPPQPLKNALLCILPVGVWIHMEDAYDYCVQIEPDRRDKHPTTHVAMSSSTTATIATTSAFSSNRRRTGSLAGAVGMVTLGPQSATTAVSKADWQVDKEKAHRLHQFVCTRMGLKPSSNTQDKDRRGGGGSDSSTAATGFTPRPTVTLEHKLATLQEYLDTTAQTPLGANKGNSNSGNTSMLGKYRQMKRFGSILRSRVSATSSLAASVAALANDNGMGSGGTSSSGGGAS